MDKKFYGLSINNLRTLVYNYCEKNKIPHPFSRENGMAGRDFAASFLKRNKDLSLRKPQGVAINRVFGLNYVIYNLNILPNVISKKEAEEKFSHLKDINIEIPETPEVAILIGADMPELLLHIEYRKSKLSDHVAVKTQLGWVLFWWRYIEKTN